MNIEENADSLRDDGWSLSPEEYKQTEDLILAQNAIYHIREAQIEGKSLDPVFEDLAKRSIAILASAAKDAGPEISYLNTAVRSLAEARFPEDFARQIAESKPR